MSKASEVISGLQEIKVADIHKALRDLDPSSWNSFMSEIQGAIQSISGEVIATSKLDKAFKKIVGRR